MEGNKSITNRERWISVKWLQQPIHMTFKHLRLAITYIAQMFMNCLGVIIRNSSLRALNHIIWCIERELIGLAWPGEINKLTKYCLYNIAYLIGANFSPSQNLTRISGPTWIFLHIRILKLVVSHPTPCRTCNHSYVMLLLQEECKLFFLIQLK